MKRLVNLYSILHTLIFAVLGVGGWFVLNHFLPQLLMKGYFVIPAFFFLLGLIFIYSFKRVPLDNPKKLLNSYMIIRMVKIFAIFVILIVYWLINKPEVRSFAIVFIVFYLLYLVWETYIFTNMEKYIKKEIEQNKPPVESIDSDDLND